MALIRLDNRNLQPPEPMVRILELLDRRARGDVLEALMDRRPAFLFPELEERGLSFTCVPNDIGGFTLRVGDPAPAAPADEAPSIAGLHDEVRAALGNVIDPELGIDVISLGLIYQVDIVDSHIHILMTLTVSGCPMSASIKADVEAALRSLSWVKSIDVVLTFDPPWSPNRLSPQARVLLGR